LPQRYPLCAHLPASHLCPSSIPDGHSNVAGSGKPPGQDNAPAVLGAPSHAAGSRVLDGSHRAGAFCQVFFHRHGARSSSVVSQRPCGQTQTLHFSVEIWIFLQAWSLLGIMVHPCARVQGLEPVGSSFGQGLPAGIPKKALQGFRWLTHLRRWEGRPTFHRNLESTSVREPPRV
jgi:hypothetical protein